MSDIMSRLRKQEREKNRLEYIESIVKEVRKRLSELKDHELNETKITISRDISVRSFY